MQQSHLRPATFEGWNSGNGGKRASWAGGHLTPSWKLSGCRICGMWPAVTADGAGAVDRETQRWGEPLGVWLRLSYNWCPRAVSYYCLTLARQLRHPPPSNPAPLISVGCVIAMVKTLIKGELGQALGGVSPFGAAVNLHWLWIWSPPSNASSSSSAPSSSSSASAARLRSHCAHTWPGPGQFERTKARGWAAAIKQLWHESAKEAGGSQWWLTVSPVITDYRLGAVTQLGLGHP